MNFEKQCSSFNKNNGMANHCKIDGKNGYEVYSKKIT
jgi:hypothetical protein